MQLRNIISECIRNTLREELDYYEERWDNRIPDYEPEAALLLYGTQDQSAIFFYLWRYLL